MQKGTNFLILILLVVFSNTTLSAQFYSIHREKPTTFKVISKSTDSIPITSVTLPSDSVKEHKNHKEILSDFCLPVREIIVTSPFGPRNDPFTGKKKFHKGIDFKTNASPIFATHSGRVKKIGYQKNGLGNFIVIDHGLMEITYGHLSTIFLNKRDRVEAGSPIGISGSTGKSTGDHLHFSIKYNGNFVDPTPFLIFISKRNNI